MESFLRRISPRQYEEWKQFYNREPFGHLRDDLHAGLLASMIVNTAANRKKGAKRLEVSDVLDLLPTLPTDAPTDDERENERRTASAVAFVEAANALLGGADLRKR